MNYKDDNIEIIDSKLIYSSSQSSVVKIRKGVVEIGEKCFCDNETIKKVIIPSSVEKIDVEAFAHSNLEEIIFEEGSKLKQICSSAFAFSKLKNIEIPDTVKLIGKDCFLWCDCQIKLPSKIKVLNDNCYSSQSLIIVPTSVNKINCSYPMHFLFVCQGNKMPTLSKGLEKHVIFYTDGILRKFDIFSYYVSGTGYDRYVSIVKIKPVDNSIIIVPREIHGVHVKFVCPYFNNSDCFEGKIFIPNSVEIIQTDLLKDHSNIYIISDGKYNEHLFNVDFEIGNYSEINIKSNEEFDYVVLSEGTIKVINVKNVGLSVRIPKYIDGYKVTQVENASIVLRSNKPLSYLVDVPDSIPFLPEKFICRNHKKLIITRNQNEWIFPKRNHVYTNGKHQSYNYQCAIPISIKKDGVFVFAKAKDENGEYEQFLVDCDKYEIDRIHAHELTIPTYVDDLPVSRILKECFQRFNIESLERINLPKKLQVIESKAFSNFRIRSLELPDTLEFIGYRAFESLKLVHSIKIPDSIKYIGSDGIFFKTKIYISSSVDRSLFGDYWYGQNDFDEVMPDGTTVHHKVN